MLAPVALLFFFAAAAACASSPRQRDQVDDANITRFFFAFRFIPQQLLGGAGPVAVLMGSGVRGPLSSLSAQLTSRKALSSYFRVYINVRTSKTPPHLLRGHVM